METVCMASAWAKLDRWLLLVVTGVLATSTGVASIATGEAEAVTGHTAFVQIVRDGPNGQANGAPPVEYGLASFQESWLFGAFSRTRILDEGSSRMVFAWAEDAPDPRHDDTLLPTGQHALVYDRNGVGWSVYEFWYLGVAPGDGATLALYLNDAAPDKRIYKTYGVRLGAVHEHEGPWKGETRYNWALSYKLDQLFPHGPSVPERLAVPVDDERPVDPVAEAARAAGEIGTSVRIVAEPETLPAEYHVLFGLGDTPEALEQFDPASGGAEPYFRSSK